jgi:transposase InsO family protein
MRYWHAGLNAIRSIETPQVHHAARRRGSGVATRGACAAACDAGDRLSRQQIVGWHG